MDLRWIYLISILSAVSGESLYFKQPKDHDPSTEIRGNSFGLENFLLQAYKDVDVVNSNNNHNNNPVKRTRVKETHKKEEPMYHRGQTYGLENLAPTFYNFRQPLDLDYMTDFRPIEGPIGEQTKRRVPVPEPTRIVDTRIVDSDDRRERNKIRKPGKQIRRPVTPSKPPTTTTTTTPRIEPQNVEIEFQESVRNGEQSNINETILPEASYAVPKIQEIPASEKDGDQENKQRPRKRVTMRRRRKKPQSASSDLEKIVQVNGSRTESDVEEGYEAQKEVDTVRQTTTSTTTSTTAVPITTTTIRERTDKVRPNRRRPGGFRKTQTDDSDPQETILRVESTTAEYRNDSESNDGFLGTTFTPETNDNDEEYHIRSPTTTTTTTTTTSRSTSSEETSAADLKAILKQQNGPLSLSELLQTQNLSLADFLKNRKEAALLLSGRRGTQTSTSRPDSREYSRPYASTIGSKGRPFTRNRHENDYADSRSQERDKSVEHTTVAADRHAYNGFVPKNPRQRYGHFKGVHPTIKSTFKSDDKSVEERNNPKTGYEQGRRPVPFAENTTNVIEKTEYSNRTRGETKSIPKRFNDMRLKLRVHRRKYNPFSTTNRINKDEKPETTTQPITTVTVSSTQTTEATSTTTEEVVTTKRTSLRIPFKSSNNPELSLILPSKDKSEEKTEKRERYSNYSSRLHTLKKSNQEKEDTKSKEITIEQTKNSERVNEMKLPLDILDMDDEKEIVHIGESTERSDEEKDKMADNKRVEAVGKIPLPSENPKYESKDEILELLKPGSSSDRLQRILESRNMTVKELLENREKSSLHSNFTQLFQEPKLVQPKIEIRTTTTTADPTFKVFQSLPDFGPIHRNLFQKNVKDLKSNSYPDSQVDESRPVPIPTRMTVSPNEPRGSKQLSGVVEVKKKLQLNSDSEGRDSFEGNDGILEQWNAREKILYYNNPIPKVQESVVTQTVRSNVEKFLVNENVDNDVGESDIILLETIQKSQEANKKLKSNINEILQEQSQVRDTKNDLDKSFIPPAVKSAIIASGVVMGLALFVFIAIFAACGWKQRQIRLRARSSILNDALAKSDSDKKVQRTSALSPASFKQSSVYKKSLEMDEETSSGASISSNASSYLWNTLKNTFAGRNSMLKNRLDKEDKTREERLEGLKGVLRNHETRRSDLLVEEDPSEETFSNAIRRQEERYSMRKNDCLKRSPSFSSSNHFSSCTHGH